MKNKKEQQSRYELLESIPGQYLEALAEISREINSIQQTNKLLHKILNIALQQLSAERGLILHKDEHNQDEFITGAAKNLELLKINNREILDE